MSNKKLKRLLKAATTSSQKLIVSKNGICEKLYVLSQKGAYWAYCVHLKA